MKNTIIDLVLREEKKFNASGSRRGMKEAHRSIAAKVSEAMRTKEGKLDMALVRRVNWRNLWEKLVVEQDLEENLTSSAFPTIAGELISSVIIDGYESFPKNALRLMRTVPSRRKISQIVGWSAIGRVTNVGERENYPEIDPPKEKVFTINNEKHGAIVSLTKETIFFDQTNELINRARQIGEEAARRQDEIGWAALDGSASDAFNPAGVATPLYSGGNNNLNTSNPLGTAGWEAADVALTQQVDDNTGKPIWVFSDRPVMVVPAGLKHVAWKLRNNDRGDLGGPNLDMNPAKDAFDFIINPYAASQTEWFYGSFIRQFRWEEIWPVETFSRVGQDTDEGFKADVIQSFKVGFFGGAGAVETRYVSKNTI